MLFSTVTVAYYTVLANKVPMSLAIYYLLDSNLSFLAWSKKTKTGTAKRLFLTLWQFVHPCQYGVLEDTMEKEMCLWYDSSANILKLSFSTTQLLNHASTQQTQHDGLFQVLAPAICGRQGGLAPSRLLYEIFSIYTVGHPAEMLPGNSFLGTSFRHHGDDWCVTVSPSHI